MSYAIDNMWVILWSLSLVGTIVMYHKFFICRKKLQDIEKSIQIYRDVKARGITEYTTAQSWSTELLDQIDRAIRQEHL